MTSLIDALWVVINSIVLVGTAIGTIIVSIFFIGIVLWMIDELIKSVSRYFRSYCHCAIIESLEDELDSVIAEMDKDGKQVSSNFLEKLLELSLEDKVVNAEPTQAESEAEGVAASAYAKT